VYFSHSFIFRISLREIFFVMGLLQSGTMAQETDVRRFGGESIDQDDLRVLKLWFSQYVPDNGSEDAIGRYSVVYEVGDEQSFETHSAIVDDEQKVTNYVAAYKALNQGLRLLSEVFDDNGSAKVLIYGDFEGVIQQVRGESRTNEQELRDLRRETHALLDRFYDWDIQWENDSHQIDKASQLAKQESEMEANDG
jgi:ribonuclease HI